MSPVVLLRAVLIVAAIGFGASAFVLSFTIERTQDAVRRITRHETAWTGANARNEVAWLKAAAASYVASGTDADESKLYQSYDIVQGRIKLLESGDFARLTVTTVIRQQRFAKLKQLVKALGPVLNELPLPEAWQRFGGLIDETSVLITRIATDAQAAGLAAAREVSEELSYKQLLQNGLLAGLVLSVGMLVVLGEYQNRLLTRARRSAEMAKEQFQHLARHDVLTSLPNRAAFREALESAVSDGSKERGQFALFVLDLDGFKPINDTLGHAVGDAILCSVADRLSRQLRDVRDAVSRFGGDEFVLLLHGVNDAGDALRRANELRTILREPHLLAGHSLVIDVSIGVAVRSGTNSDVDLLDHADIALNEAKSLGRAQIALFRPQMLEQMEHRARLERDLSTALTAGDIIPAYQVQIDIPSGRVVGVEALARWSHPVYGNIPPGEFIPVAESSGQISEVGRTILEQACCDTARHFPDNVSVSVNVSAAQIVQDDFPLLVAQVLSRSNLPASRLILEITESAMMKDLARAQRTVQRLRQLGVLISLDDFGTGHSSLSYLRRFHLDELKIDRSFVTNLEASAEDVAIVMAIVQLARTLNVAVVAEGVETPGQLDRLAALGCTRAQGYLLGKPASVRTVFSGNTAVPQRMAS